MHERNSNLAAPTATAGGLSADNHKPTPLPDGSLACSGCGAMCYSPAAFAAHLAGKGMLDAEKDVYTMGTSDPWLEQQQPERKQEQAEADSAAWREETVAAYWDQQRRAKPRIAVGGNSSAFFE